MYMHNYRYIKIPHSSSGARPSGPAWSSYIYIYTYIIYIYNMLE